MTGQGGEALELALGLLRAPALRSALRRRPLPDDIGQLLTIASESSEALREASTRTGRPTSELVEAARFYIQQVLLADDADAYRTLGATPDAGHAVLRDHHRLLLRWLHPDRSREGAQWDSALSTRVNQAWNQLRTPGARARYDAGRAAAEAPGAAPGPDADAPVPAGIPRPVTYRKLDAPEPIPTGPIAVAFLTLACLALAWLAWTREDRLDELRDANRFQPPRVDVSERMAAPLPHVLPEVDVRAPAPAPLVRVPAALGSPASQAPAPSPTRDQTRTPVGAATAATGQDQTPIAAGAAPTEAAPKSLAQTQAPVGAATAAIDPAKALGHGRPAPDLAPVGAATAAISPTKELGHGETAIAAIAAPTKAAPTKAAPAKVAAANAGGDPVRLFHEAESAIANVTTWFAASSGHEPLWLDPQAASGGNSARDGLRTRQALDARTRLAVDQPNWTLGTGTASMSGAYRLQGRRGTLETGVLHVRLARRGDQWRVAGLQLEPAQ